MLENKKPKENMDGSCIIYDDRENNECFTIEEKNEFSCSSIEKANQSSFLSEVGKNILSEVQGNKNPMNE